jgi:dTDP-4-amino-4,6-dideoxygalactose transaminase
LTRLNWLQRFNARRQEIASEYLKGINNPLVQFLAAPTPGSHNYHLFVVRSPERNRLAKFMAERGVETAIHYPIPAHLQDCCPGIRVDPKGLPNAEKHALECLSLPCHPQLSDNDVATVLAAVNQFR